MVQYLNISGFTPSTALFFLKTAKVEMAHCPKDKKKKRTSADQKAFPGFLFVGFFSFSLNKKLLMEGNGSH